MLLIKMLSLKKKKQQNQKKPYAFTEKLGQINWYQSNQYNRDFLILNTNLLNKPEQLLFLLLLTTNTFFFFFNFSIIKSTVFFQLDLSPLVQEAYAENLFFFLIYVGSMFRFTDWPSVNILPKKHASHSAGKVSTGQNRRQRAMRSVLELLRVILQIWKLNKN